MNVRQELFNNCDEKYKQFHSALIPNISSDLIIGVRIPVLRRLAKQLDNNSFEWHYYEEKMLHGFYIGYAKISLEERLRLLSDFVPQIDNWAVCDCVCSTLKFANSNKAEVLEFLKPYMESDREYEKRFAIVMLMTYFLEGDYFDFTLEYLTSLRSEYYYVNMAVAWALSVAFVKKRDKVLPIIEAKSLPAFVHNKAISKICDSLRVDRATKEYLKKYRKKDNLI